jgi:hypothetical protein
MFFGESGSMKVTTSLKERIFIKLAWKHRLRDPDTLSGRDALTLAFHHRQQRHRPISYVIIEFSPHSREYHPLWSEQLPIRLAILAQQSSTLELQWLA